MGKQETRGEAAKASTERRLMVVYVAAAPGWVRAARGIIGRAMRRALKARTWQTAPHHVVYYPEGWDGYQRRSAQYNLDATDAEAVAIYDECKRLADAEGWDEPPVDIYHD